MPRASFTPRSLAPLVSDAFAPADWRLLVRLPAEVMIATVVARAGGDPGRRTVAEGLAGLDAIASGRNSDSDLVRAVVAAIYAEPEDDRAGREADPAGDPTGEPAGNQAGVLADCRRVVAVLRAVADPADAAAYRHWVQQVVVRVCAATARPGGDGARRPDRDGARQLDGDGARPLDRGGAHWSDRDGAGRCDELVAALR